MSFSLIILFSKLYTAGRLRESLLTILWSVAPKRWQSIAVYFAVSTVICWHVRLSAVKSGDFCSGFCSNY